MVEDAAPLRACPQCGKVGKKVELVTLQSLVKPESQGRITEGQYRFCGTQGCDVVYFAEDGSHVFLRSELSVRVGVKETDAPRPICYCFNHSIEEIRDEIRRTGTTRIPDEIRRRIESEGCHCEETNPQGSCCLGAVARFAEAGE